MNNDNVGKCGHAKCAGGNGTLCYEKGKPMRTYEEIKKENESKTWTASTLDTPYTLDTYATFTLDCEESLMDEGKTYEDYEWEYDTKEYLAALAANWEKLMTANILDKVILSVTVTGAPTSPREYNFTTDSAPISITYNPAALQEYIAANQAHYKENKRHSVDGYMWLGDETDAQLIYYMENESTRIYSTDNYVMDQYENVPEYEYVYGKLIAA